jgi:AcrR family transcriptional regulator
MSRPGDPNAKIDLLRAAEAVFIAHGLEKARVEDITALAGRSKGSFYLHFETKEDVFRQIVETLLARLATCIDEPPPESGGGPVDLAALLERSLQRDVEVFEFLW